MIQLPTVDPGTYLPTYLGIFDNPRSCKKQNPWNLYLSFICYLPKYSPPSQSVLSLPTGEKKLRAIKYQTEQYHFIGGFSCPCLMLDFWKDRIRYEWVGGKKTVWRRREWGDEVLSQTETWTDLSPITGFITDLICKKIWMVSRTQIDKLFFSFCLLHQPCVSSLSLSPFLMSF